MKRESAIEVTAEHNHTVTLITELSREDAVALKRATEGILWFLLQHEGEPLNPNSDCFKPVGGKPSKPLHENGLGIFLDYNQALINSLTDPDDDETEEIFLDSFIERWEEEGPKKRATKKGKRG